jgi:heme/copper-type cytochrome/quinol oxidase subunit 2
VSVLLSASIAVALLVILCLLWFVISIERFARGNPDGAHAPENQDDE